MSKWFSVEKLDGQTYAICENKHWEETMSYNAKWGGTIPFPEDEWGPWYEAWVINPGAKVNSSELVP